MTNPNTHLHHECIFPPCVQLLCACAVLCLSAGVEAASGYYDRGEAQGWRAGLTAGAASMAIVAAAVTPVCRQSKSSCIQLQQLGATYFCCPGTDLQQSVLQLQQQWVLQSHLSNKRRRRMLFKVDGIAASPLSAAARRCRVFTACCTC